MKNSPNTLIELLRQRAGALPQQHAYLLLADGTSQSAAVTYAALDTRSREIASHLQSIATPGDRALLLYPTGLDVLAAFFGCLYAGLIAIPAAPPEGSRRMRTLPRLRAIVDDAGASVVLTTTEIAASFNDDTEGLDEMRRLQWVDTTSALPVEINQWHPPTVQPESLAYLQYTSGSTRSPKGVMISHENVLHHLASLTRSCGYGHDSRTVTWMPYFHDYGLIEGLLQPLFNGTPCYVMSPVGFIKRPLHWLHAISQFRATHSQGPNFAYEHCLRRIAPENRIGLDLSNWRAAGNGAEPINPKTLQEFTAAFAPYGFRRSALCPAYGLAEATLVVSFNAHTSEPTILAVDAGALENHQIVQRRLDDPGTRTVVGCGRPIADTRVAIVRPDDLTRCAPDEVGEIWVADPSVAQGYWQRHEETEEVFHAYTHDTREGPFMRTGDLGFLKGGELFVTGRLKDLIIIRGSNHYPQDIEWTVQACHEPFQMMAGAAFSIWVNNEERLAFAQEVDRREERHLDTEAAFGAIRRAVGEEHQLDLSLILLCRRGTLPKTSSGKMQRRGCRDGALNGRLDTIAVWAAADAASIVAQLQQSRATDLTDAAVSPSVGLSTAE